MDPPRLDTLPTELLFAVATRLPPRSIRRLAATCRATAAALKGPPSVWVRLLPPELRAAAAAAAAAGDPGQTGAAAGSRTTAATGLAAAPNAETAALLAAMSSAGLPIARNAAGVPSAVVVLPADDAVSEVASGARPLPPCPPAGAPWRLVLPLAGAAVTCGHVNDHWQVVPGGGPAGCDALRLEAVRWFDVVATAMALPAGAYAVALEMAPARQRCPPWTPTLHGVGVVVEVLTSGVAATDVGASEADDPPVASPPRVVTRQSPGALVALALPFLAQAETAAAQRAARRAADGSGHDDGSDRRGGQEGGGVHRADVDLSVDTAAERFAYAAFRGTLPWARVALSRRLVVPAGGGVRVALVGHDVSVRKSGVLFGGVRLTPLEGSAAVDSQR